MEPDWWGDQGDRDTASRVAVSVLGVADLLTSAQGEFHAALGVVGAILGAYSAGWKRLEVSSTFLAVVDGLCPAGCEAVAVGGVCGYRLAGDLKFGPEVRGGWAVPQRGTYPVVFVRLRGDVLGLVVVELPLIDCADSAKVWEYSLGDPNLDVLVSERVLGILTDVSEKEIAG